MKATTETIAEMLNRLDRLNMAKVRPRVRLALIPRMKRSFINFIADTFGGRMVRHHEKEY